MEFVEIASKRCVSRMEFDHTMLAFLDEDDKCVLISIYGDRDFLHVTDKHALDFYAKKGGLKEIIPGRVYMDKRFIQYIVRFFEMQEGHNVWVNVLFVIGDDIKETKIYDCDYDSLKAFVCIFESYYPIVYQQC